MHLITKEVTFDMAHMLTGHAGLCKNVHGHTYKLEVVVKSEDVINPDDKVMALASEKSSEGMLVDFKDLKEVLKYNITDKYDHAFNYWNGSEEECEIADMLMSMDKKVVDSPFRTTAENMSKQFFEDLKPLIESLPGNCELQEVRLWETPTSCAIYRGDD